MTIMLFVASLAFGFLAFLTLGNAVQSFRARNLLGQIPFERGEATRTSLRTGTLASGVVGLSFAAASVIVWTSWPFALVLAGWPILLFAALFATGHVDVISKLSSE